jgi:thimet oligopeptidase
MRNFAFAALLAAGLPAAAQENPMLLPVLDAPAVARNCDAGIARARSMIDAMEAKSGGEGFFAEWDALQIAMEEARNPIALMGTVHPEKVVRDATEPCLQKYTALASDLFQNEKLYARLSGTRPAAPKEEKLKRDLMEGFEDSGVTLPTDKRARAKAIAARLEEIRQSFERNSRDDPTRVKLAPAETRGLPEGFLKAAAKDAEGNVILKPDDPTYFTVMSTAAIEEVRKRFYVASMNRGGEANLGLLEEAYRLRRELAGLHGRASFAELQLRRRMAGSPQAVDKFLAEVEAAVAPVERKELAELAKLKARDTGQPLETVKLGSWDAPYYTEVYKRENFSIDQEKLRKNFPVQKSVEYAMLVAETLYGIKFREGRAPAWHPEVRYYEIFAAASGKYLANIYVDLYARDGKRGGAFAFSTRRASALAGRKPQSVLVTNFSPEGLNHRQFETLLHEFGHVLHGVLSTADYASQAGTSVKRDFVEAPSQMFEEWVRREQSLALFRKVCAGCPALSAAEIGRLEGARKFGRGIAVSRQATYARLDMELSKEAQPVMPLWKRLEEARPLGHLEGTYKPANFQHLVGGYAAGYYGYMWSLVIATDLLSQFDGDLLSARTGARYRDAILAQGSQDEEMNLVRKFLGREPSPKAFFDEIAGRR